MIINGELESGIGGGVCQVSTTVFNAAFEAGLSIEKRTNHALYISHYPLGRDATVNYPDLDLVFTNDTDHWLLLRTFVGAGSLTVNLYGTPQHRRVETRDVAARRRGQGAVEADRRRHAVQGAEGRRTVRGAAPLDERQAPRVRAGRDADVRHDLAQLLRGRADRRPARDEAAAEEGEAREDGAQGHDDARGRRGRRRRSRRSPLRRPRMRRRLGPERSLENQSGTRAGRCVVASTVACLVDPVAILSPSRSTTYSKRNRAPRDSGQRTCTSEHVIEHRCALVGDLDAGRQRLDAACADGRVATGQRGQQRDAGLLEPHEVRGVVGDALRIGLGEPDAYDVREASRPCSARYISPRTISPVSTAEALATLILEKGPAVVLTRRRDEHRERHPRLSLARRALGAGRSLRGGLDRRVPQGPPACVELVRPSRDDARLGRAEPGHLALAELERDGYVRTVATQNIDALHHRAGSSDVVELHGSIRRFDCLACGAVASLGMVLAQLREDAWPHVRSLRLDPEAGRRHVRRAAPRAGDGTSRGALSRDRPARRRRLVARGVARRRVARRDSAQRAGSWRSSTSARRPTTATPGCSSGSRWPSCSSRSPGSLRSGSGSRSQVVL